MTQRVDTDSRHVEAKVKGVPSDSRYFQVLDFALALPSSLAGTASEPGPLDHTLTRSGEHGIVGVITILSPKSVMIWLGWGDLRNAETLSSIDGSSEGGHSRDSQHYRATGNCTFFEDLVRQATNASVTNN